jgi:23S rRNA (adenine2030-N6)-methyltransferase
MNYRHLYHAGNFADVFRHLLLISLIQALSRKEQPFSYIDTHAGIGNYDLQLPNAQTTQEFSNGIGKLMAASATYRPALVDTYLQQVTQWNEQHGSEQLRYYPGSPCLVRSLLRANDKMVLAELHAEDVLLLKANFKRDRQVAVHHTDGYLMLKAFLPPQPNRGLVLIDPPFEKPDEFRQIAQQLKLALQRWHTGVYAIWYPIKNDSAVKQFYRDLQHSGIRKILCCEIHLPPAERGLTACGMIIINPPWQWPQEIKPVLLWLAHALAAPERGEYHMEWLVGE